MSNDHSSDHQPSGRTVPWNPWLGVLFVLALFFASQIIGGLLVSIYPALKHWSTAQANDWLINSVGGQFFYTLVAEIITVGAIIAFLNGYRLKPSAIGLTRPRLSDVLTGFAAAPLYYLLFLVVISVSTRLITGIDVDQHQDVGFNNVHGALALVLTYISLAVLPPLAEEIMVRGFLYSSLKKAVPKLWAVLLTSALFAAAHLPEGGPSGPLWIGAIDTFTLSLVLIWLREYTGNLWASITLHAIKNTIAFLALFVFVGH